MADQTESEIRPAYYAQKCPVCNGWGTVSFKKINCHACSGKGYLRLPIDIQKKDHGKSGKK